MSMVAITGGTGFVGQHLLALLANRNDLPMRVLIHHNCNHKLLDQPNITQVEGDLLKPETLSRLLQPGCTVVNLVYLRDQSSQENLQAVTNLAQACAQAKIKRLIHCSTAVVAGRVSGNIINEETPCHPVNEYEFTKLAMEKALVEKSGGAFEVVILRPTAIFGPGGKNLLKLADDLSHGQRAINYIKSSLFNRRKMNLVCVDNVAAAIAFLIDTQQNFDREFFIISDSEYPLNNYRAIEKYLMARWGYQDYPVPHIPFPPFVLSFLLKLAGRSNLNPACIFDSQKLMRAGFEKPISFEAGLVSFADWYKEQFLQRVEER